MKIILSFMLMSWMLLLSCESINCHKPDFSSSLNDDPWDGYVKSCDLDITSLNNDSVFRFIVMESKPIHDKFKDILLVSRIPFQEGQYFIDSLNKDSGVIAQFWVNEHEYGTQTDTYFAIPLSGSFIEVEEIDLQSNSFVVKFHLEMSVRGGIDGELHNSTYDKFITFSDGHVSGEFED